MRPLQALALLFGLATVVLSPGIAGAAGPFSLPTVTLSAPTCAIFDADCSLSTAPLSTTFGSFSLNAQGDLSAVSPPAVGNGWCMPASGAATLSFGSSTDHLVLSATSLCYTQPADAAGAPSPLAGPWPLALTFTVDGTSSSGIYTGATGSGSIDGVWSTSVSCIDPSGNPIQQCGLSGEPLAAFTLSSVSIPDLTLVGGGTGGEGGGCVGACPPPVLGATPELDSLPLLASGLAGLGGYALLRRRARQ